MSYALITGASKGIGKELSLQLAAKGYSLLLVARAEQELKELCQEIKTKSNFDAVYLALDLSTAGAADKIMQWIQEGGFDVNILINNAGYGQWGAFADQTLEAQQTMLQVNMGVLVELTYKMIPMLRTKQKAYIMNTGSTTAFQAIPTFGLYAASKSFVHSFTRSLHHEMMGSNISVTLLSPGTTRSNFVNRADMDHVKETAEKVAMNPDAVAKSGLDAMFAGKIETIPGFINQISVFSLRFSPRKMVENIAGNIYRKK
jgi:uncharacterized protein